MTEERREQNGVDLTETLWQARRYKVLDYMGEKAGTPVPEDCYELIHVAFRCGAAAMFGVIGKERHV